MNHKKYEKALRKARRIGDVSEFIKVAEEGSLKRYKDPIVRETAKKLRTDWLIADEKEIKKIEKKVKEKNSDWLGGWLKKFSIEGDFWAKEKSSRFSKKDWL